MIEDSDDYSCDGCTGVEFGETKSNQHREYFCKRHLSIAEKHKSLEWRFAEPMILLDAYYLEKKEKHYYESANIATWFYDRIRSDVAFFVPLVKEYFVNIAGKNATSKFYWLANATVDYALNANTDVFKLHVQYMEKDGVTLDDIIPFMNERIDQIKDKSELKTILILLATIQDQNQDV